MLYNNKMSHALRMSMSYVTNDTISMLVIDFLLKVLVIIMNIIIFRCLDILISFTIAMTYNIMFLNLETC